jgi:hypothetical protein
MAVPKDLQAAVGKKLIRRTLKTSDSRPTIIKGRDVLAQVTGDGAGPVHRRAPRRAAPASAA